MGQRRDHKGTNSSNEDENMTLLFRHAVKSELRDLYIKILMLENR